MALTAEKLTAVFEAASVDFSNASQKAKIEKFLNETFQEEFDLVNPIDDPEILEALYEKGFITVNETTGEVSVSNANSGNSNSGISNSGISNLKEVSLIDLSPEQRFSAFAEGVRSFKRERFTPVYAKFSLREKPRNLSKEQARSFKGGGNQFIDLYDVVDKDFIPVVGPLKELCDSDSIRMSAKRVSYLPSVGTGTTRLMIRLIEKGRDHRNYNEEGFKNLVSGGEPDSLSMELLNNISGLFETYGKGEDDRRQISVVVPNIGEADYTISLANPQPLNTEEETKYQRVLPTIEAVKADIVKAKMLRKSISSSEMKKEIKELQQLAAEMGESLNFEQAYSLLKE